MISLIKDYIKKHKSIYIFIIVSIFYMITIMINPILSSSLINHLTGDIDITGSYKLIFLIFITAIITQIFYYIKDHIKLKLTYGLQEAAEKHVLLNLYKTDFLKLANVDKVYMSQRIHSETQVISSFTFDHLAGMITNILTLIFAVLILFGIHPLYAIISIINIPIYLLLLYKMKDKVYEAQMSGKESEARLKSTFYEQVKMMPSVKLNGIQQKSLSLFHASFQIVLDAAKRIFNYMYIFYSIDGYLTTIVQIIFFLYGVVLISNGHMDIGQFTIVLSYYALIMNAVKYFLNLSREYINFKSSLDYLHDILNMKKESSGTALIEDLKDFEIHEFSFGYENSEDIHYDFIKLNGTGLVLLQGANGCGKSTLMKLLSTLYQTEAAPFSVNGISANELDIERFRNDFISYVEQEPLLWDITLRENIQLFFDEIKSFSVFEQKIRDMGLFDFYRSAKGFEAQDWDKKISSFSTGQMKKLAIIIGSLKQKRILFLDEPTASLDTSSCEALVKFLQYYKKEHLVFVVSHDHLFDHTYDITYEM